jgi:site-specific DNA recombinase
VSTRKQEEEGTSLDTQEERCRAYAEGRGWQIVAVYREQHTGAELWERPMLTEARELIRDGAADILLSYAVDRLSRKQTHLAIVVEDIESAGGALAFVTEDFEDSSIGTFLRNTVVFAAEFEREKFAERSARGRRARATHGKLLPGCRPLYGYQWRPVPEGTPPEFAKKLERAALDIDPKTAPVVQGIFEAILAGGTLYSIASDLTKAGIPTPRGNTRWGTSTVRTILHHPHYMGAAAALRDWHNGYLASEARAVPMPPDTVPALVSEEDWHAVQRILLANKERAPRNNRNPEAYLLRGGFVRCGICGAAMQIGTIRKGVYVYRCGRGSRPGQACGHHAIRTPILDAAAWDKVTYLLTQPGAVRREVERYCEDDPTAHDLAAVEQALADVTRRQENLTRAIAAIDDTAAAAPLLTEIKALAQSKKQLEAERETVAARRAVWFATQRHLDDLSHWLQTLRTNLETLSYNEKRGLLDALGITATVYRADHDPHFHIDARIQPKGEIVSKTSVSSDRTSMLP